MINDILKKINWRCVDCGSDLDSGKMICLACGRRYGEVSGVIDALPSKMNELSSKEAHYHDHFEDNPADVHQLDSFRNYFFHNIIWEKLNSLPAGSKILEIGSGSGFDAKHLARHLDLVLTDISSQTLVKTAESLSGDNVIFSAADGLNLPFQNETFDAVFTVATFHHFDNPSLALKEFSRVLKKDGLLIIGIEPNRFYFSLIKRFRKPLIKAARMSGDSVSEADAEMEGFRYSDWGVFFNNLSWYDLKIVPMWFFTGVWHYLSEFLFRVFGLKKRLKIASVFEKPMVLLDQALMSIPFLNRLAWHFVIFVRKK